MKSLRENVAKDHTNLKNKEFEEGPKASYGYGGKFGVQKDRMDKVSLCITPSVYVCVRLYNIVH